MILIRFDEPPRYHAPGQETREARVFIDEERIGRRDVAVGMSIYGPRMAAPFHVHKGSETMFIVHGKGQFGTKEKAVEVRPGDVLHFAPNEEHFLKNLGGQTLEFLFIYSEPDDVKPIKEKWVPLAK